MIPNDLLDNEPIYFIPYTTGKRRIRMGRIDSDSKGKFIRYTGGLCDNGEYYLCRVKDIKDIQIIDRLNAILSDMN